MASQRDRRARGAVLGPPAAAAALAALLVAACGVASRAGPPSGHPPATATAKPPGRDAGTAGVAAAAPGTPGAGQVPPRFSSQISALSADEVVHTWHPGCPVGPDQLRVLTLSYWGFDGHPHTGSLVVNEQVTGQVTQAFSSLYAERFPIRQMVPAEAFGGSDPASMAADNTSAFNCRLAVAPGPPQWSVHAYGEAIDVNPVENPYLEGGTVQPPAGSAYTDRSEVRPGMALPGGELVSAFASVGWQWGGRWLSSPDYQHFSSTGG